MSLIAFLIIFPLVVAGVLGIVKNEKARGAVVAVEAGLTVAASVALFVLYAGSGEAVRFTVHIEAIDTGMTVVLLLISAYIIYAGIRDGQPWASALAGVQILATIGSEIYMRGRAAARFELTVDNLALIMVLIVGIVGSLICVFSVGYMKKYHRHKHVKDRSRFFFAVIFAFMSAMFGLVLSNSLTWLLFFWEITTFCSYLLIGYSREPEAIRNAYRALIMNMVGGIAFLAGVVILVGTQGVVEVDKLLGLNPAIAAIPVVLICFSGLVKSAQMPFSSWLLGAMVAPSPTSALLHSSTMVKAGVYIIIRLSPLLVGTKAGFVIALIGSATFLFASLIAISARNIKRMLAYSTIATLGLIVTCAAVGTYQAVWTSMLLMIFHAVAKSLLFLCAGTVENGIDSLDIEHMDGLITRMPKVTVFLLIGIAGMFIAPFGMLISKWAALEALIKVNPLVTILVVFGSSATMLFYTKLMGKLIMITHPTDSREGGIGAGEWMALGSLALLTVVTCLAFPLISRYLIDPYIHLVYAHSVSMGQGNVAIMLIMMAFVLLIPAQIILQKNQEKHVNAFLSGANVSDAEDPLLANDHFITAKSEVAALQLSNYYIEDWFGEKKLGKPSFVVAALLLAALFVVMLI